MDHSVEEQGLSGQNESPANDLSTANGKIINGENVSSTDHQFQKAISAWRTIDLGNLVPQLDKTAQDVVENQKDALVQRKELAQKTKDFRKLDDSDKLSEWKVLLKAYQNFVDLLTNHGKTTSNAFLEVYSSLSEAPDPYPLLEASVDSLLVSEDTVPKLTAENEHLQKTIRNLTRDLELAENQVQQERASRKELEESRETKSKKIETSWQAVLDEKKDNWEAREKALEEKLENQERLFNEIKASYEVSQRLGHSQDGGSNAQVTASAAELEMVNSELERTGVRLAEMEARNEQLLRELAQASSNVPKKANVEDDPAFTRLRSENSSLLRKLDAAKFDKDSETRKFDGQRKTLERDVQSLQQEKEELREKMLQWRDYPEIKRELEVFKAIEFSATGDDDDTTLEADNSNGYQDGSGVDSANGGSKKESLEQLLLARNKKLSSEMAVLRVSHQDLQKELENLRETMSSTNADLERAQNLNATLENDLLTLQQEASNQFPMSAKSVSSRYPSSATYARSPFSGGPPSSYTPRRGGSPTSSIISGFDPQRSPYESFDSLRAGEAVGGGSGILPMIQAQRDRFKTKNSQLEAELQKQYNTVSSLRQEIAALQKDNLNLYEKTRYASSYQRSGSSNPQASSASAYSASPSNTAIQIGSSDSTSSGLTMDRYRSAYEANISPFAAFRGREATRAYKRMSMPERMIYSVTRLVLANRTSRNLFALYCVALHVLIFIMLYWMQTVDVEKHATKLGQAAAAAAAGAGGLGTGAGAGGGGTGADAHHGEWHQEGLDGTKPG